MRRWWVSWPMAVAAIVTALNVELVLIPLLVTRGIAGVSLFVCAGAAASCEVSYWYWFAGWLGQQAPFIPVVQNAVRDFREQGIIGRLRANADWARVVAADAWSVFVGHVRAQMDASAPFPRWLLARALGIIRTSPVWMMYPMMIGLGLCPLGWIPGIFICRKHRVRGAFATLLAFNAIKTYGIGVVWALFIRWMGTLL